MDLLRRLVGTGVRGSDDDPLLLLALLYRRGVLSRSAYRSLNRFFSLTDDSTAPVSAGEDLTRYRVSDQDRELLRSLMRLGAWAPARFEEHVLSVLVEQAPYDWDLAMDVPLGPDRPDSVRVDSLVRYRSREVVIEVRASLGLLLRRGPPGRCP